MKISPGDYTRSFTVLSCSYVTRLTTYKMTSPSANSRKCDTRRIALASLFCGSLLIVVWVLRSLPSLSSKQLARLRIPTSADDVRLLNDILSVYKEENYWSVLGVFCVLYVFLQTFAIPGPIVLSLLSGALFGKYIGLAIVSIVATIGAMFCYLLTMSLGRSLVYQYFPNQISGFKSKIDQHRDNLLYYMLFLRLTPIFPNLFVNMASPIIDIPLGTFTLATFFGLIPANYLHVTTGMTLQNLRSIHGALDWKALFLLFGLGGLALIPTLFKTQLQNMESALERRSPGRSDSDSEENGEDFTVTFIKSSLRDERRRSKRTHHL
eukprot:379054_1